MEPCLPRQHSLLLKSGPWQANDGGGGRGGRVFSRRRQSSTLWAHDQSNERTRESERERRKPERKESGEM